MYENMKKYAKETCWERADLLALLCGVLLWVCYFPIGILGQVWYLIVLIPDLCTLSYFEPYECLRRHVWLKNDFMRGSREGSRGSGPPIPEK